MPEPSSGLATGFRRVADVMGTSVSLELADPLGVRTLNLLADDTFAWLREVDERFSTYIRDSEINRLDRGELSSSECSADMHWVLDECARLWRATDGYFDIQATGRLDPSGYVKGWSVQVASDRLRAAGAVNHCLNAGGDVRVCGQQVPGQPWRVGIAHPWQRDKLCWVVEGTDLAIATSGTYIRGYHVINPRTGAPARELRSVTVIGTDLGLADGYATAATAMGLAGLDWLGRLHAHQASVVTEDGRCFRSDGFPIAHIRDEAAAQPAPAGQSGGERANWRGRASRGRPTPAG